MAEGEGEAGGNVRVVDDGGLQRYEIFVGDELAGFTTYKDRADARIVIHSEVFPEFEHRGLGGVLARGTLDDIRARGLHVVPRCPFVVRYVKEHPEYDDIVAE